MIVCAYIICYVFFFPFARCSRVYWSTTDARKRCVYTCKIMECRPPVVEPDINSTVEHDDNRTIAHSPSSFIDVPCKDSQSTTAILGPPSPDRPHSQTSSSCYYHVISKVPRIRTPSYSPTQRSPGCRPLPSAGKGLVDSLTILLGNLNSVTFTNQKVAYKQVYPNG